VVEDLTSLSSESEGVCPPEVSLSRQRVRLALQTSPLQAVQLMVLLEKAGAESRDPGVQSQSCVLD